MNVELQQNGFITIVNWCTIIGLPLTLIGLCMTYFQGRKIKSAAEAARESASSTAKQIDSIFAIENNTKIIEHLYNCEDLLHQENWNEVISILRSTKIELSSLRNKGSYKSVRDTEFNIICRDIQMDIDNLRSKKNGEEFNPDITLINNHIDKAIEIFTLIHSEIKDNYRHAENN